MRTTKSALVTRYARTLATDVTARRTYIALYNCGRPGGARRVTMIRICAAAAEYNNQHNPRGGIVGGTHPGMGVRDPHGMFDAGTEATRAVQCLVKGEARGKKSGRRVGERRSGSAKWVSDPMLVIRGSSERNVRRRCRRVARAGLQCYENAVANA